MVVLGSFSSRVGANSPRRASLGGGSGAAGSRKTIYSSKGSTKSAQHSQDKYKISSQVQETANGMSYNKTRSGVNGSSTSKATTDINQRKKWGFYDALVGQRGKTGDVESADNVSSGYRQKAGEMKIRFVKNDGKSLKDGMKVDYNRRKSKQRIEVTLDEGSGKLSKGAFRRKIADKISKEIRAHSKGTSRFRRQQGMSYLSNAQRRIIAKDMRSSSAMKTALKRAGSGSLGHTKSNRRTFTVSGK